MVRRERCEKQRVIGTYYMGTESVNLVLRNGTGGEFYLTPELGSVARIKVGMDYDEWNKVVSVLLHEATELAYERMRARYELSGVGSGDHSSYLFVISHVNFSDACTYVAEFISDCLPDLKKAWRGAKRG